MTDAETKRAIARTEWMTAIAIMMLNACTAMLVYLAGTFAWGWPSVHPMVVVCFGWLANAMGLRPDTTLRDPLPHLGELGNVRRAMADMLVAVLIRTFGAAGLCAVAWSTST